MSLDLDSLDAFARAATTLNFTAAAQQAHLSPAAFSERIRGLEDTLGLRLFDRTTRSVRLTPAGERLLPQARACLDAASGLLQTAQGARDDWEITLGSRFELGLSWLTPALDPLAAAEPHRRIHLWLADAPALAEAVRAGRIDAMVTSTRAEAEEFVSEPLHPEAYAFVGAPGLLDERPLGGPADAVAHTLLDIGPGLPLFRYLQDAHGGPVWPFAQRAYLGGIGPIRARCLAGKGVAVLPRYFIEADLVAGALRPLLPALALPVDMFRLTWRSGHPRSADLRQLAAALRALPLA
jgi:DNA-binding transcriptional LysR family regulator